MKTSTKAMLLSALIYPGAGQLYLKTYLLAAILIAVTTVTLYVLLMPVVAIANELTEKILSGERQADSNLLAEVLAATQHVSAMQTINTASLILLVTWLTGVIHAWRSGRTPER